MTALGAQHTEALCVLTPQGTGDGLRNRGIVIDGEEYRLVHHRFHDACAGANLIRCALRRPPAWSHGEEAALLLSPDTRRVATWVSQHAKSACRMPRAARP